MWSVFFLTSFCLGFVLKGCSIVVRSILKTGFATLSSTRIVYGMCMWSACEMVSSEAVLGAGEWDVWCYVR